MVDSTTIQPVFKNYKFKVHHNCPYTEYMNSLKENKSKLKSRLLWTNEEDSILRNIMKELTKTDSFCKKRKGRWIVAKQRLDQYYEKGLIKHTKSPKQLRERWLNILSWNQEKLKPWTKEEDIALCSLKEKYGTKWKLIKKSFPLRNEYHVKNRYYMLKKRKKKPNPIKLGVGKYINKEKEDNLIKESTGPEDSPCIEQKAPKIETKQNEEKEAKEKKTNNEIEFNNESQVYIKAFLQNELNNLLISTINFQNSLNEMNLFNLLFSGMNDEKN